MQYELKILFDSEAETFTLEDAKLKENQTEPEAMPTNSKNDNLAELDRKLRAKGLPSLAQRKERREAVMKAARKNAEESSRLLSEYRRENRKRLVFG